MNDTYKVGTVRHVTKDGVFAVTINQAEGYAPYENKTSPPSIKKLLPQKYITINPQDWDYEEAITDPQNPIFKSYKRKGDGLIAVLSGKKGVALVMRGAK